MNLKKKFFAMPSTILFSTILCASLTMMGCASGTPKIEGFQIDDRFVQAVQQSCVNSYPDASDGTIGGLWANKRIILRRSRDCTEAATTLAEQVANRNKVLGK